jgi:hypothetical protein
MKDAPYHQATHAAVKVAETHCFISHDEGCGEATVCLTLSVMWTFSVSTRIEQ